MAEELRSMLTYSGDTAPLQAYLSRPAGDGPRAAAIVIHEIYGLTPHIQDVADRLAAQGYVALAPNLFSRPELAEMLSPAVIDTYFRIRASLPAGRQMDQAYLEQEISKLPAEQRQAVKQAAPLLSGGWPRESFTRDLVRTVEYLKTLPFVIPDKIASIGFCFGGSRSFDLACHAPLAACVVFYGENPNPLDLAANIPCPVLGLYGAEDMRINSHLGEMVQKMAGLKKDFEMRIYPGAGHAFFNDTRPQVYREPAAREAWERVLRFFKRTL
jgi:carboxymethylenebutenolidase